MNLAEKFRLLVWPTALGALIVAPWYVYTVIQIRAGHYTSNIQYVTQDIYGGLSYSERFVTALRSLDSYAYIFIFLLLALVVFDNAYRWLVVTIILPYTVLWAVFLSYEHRNLAIAFPLAGVAAGVGLQRFMEAANLKRLSAYALPAILIGAVFAGSLLYKPEFLAQRQVELQKQIFNAQLNKRLYTYFNNHDGPERVMTDYPINWLPGLRGYWVLEQFRDYQSYQKRLSEQPDVELLLIPDDADERIYEEVLANIASGTYNHIFTQNEYMLVRIPARQ
jgi:hypothetical protein